jgi:rhodanese-related sulfurtransferase
MHPSSRPPFKAARPAEIKRRLDAGEQLRLIDVREHYEYQAARVDAAELLPMSEIQSWWKDLPRDEELVIMCHHGSRSAQVCMALSGAGFEHLTNLEGGIDAWSRDVDPSVPRY